MPICPTEFVMVPIVLTMIKFQEILSAQPISSDMKNLLVAYILTLTTIVLLQLTVSHNDSKHRILLMSSDPMIMRTLGNQALHWFSLISKKATLLKMATFGF